MSAVSFDLHTKTLLFVPAYFKANPADAFVSWRVGMSAGRVLHVGSVIADIYWEDAAGTIEPIASPVAGTILKTNRQISHPTLHHQPPQIALILI